MKICAYVQGSYAKKTYKNECLDTRQFVGLRVIIDALKRAGYDCEWAGMATVHLYDVVLVSLTADCDWWSFIAERLQWQKGNFKVIVGGAGVLHVAPFTRWVDYFSIGRGEISMVELIKYLDGKDVKLRDSIIETASFSPEKIYHIEQTDVAYPHRIELATNENGFCEQTIGCNHRCLFCGYTWHRKFVSPNNYYKMEDGLFGDIADKERAMLDIMQDESSVNFSKLRTTAIDGFSERLRYMVNKRISNDCMKNFIQKMICSDAKPHQIKFYNICGYPTETESDWLEFLETIKEADQSTKTKNEKQWSIVLHSTPFRSMPATPLACAPMSLKNYRGLIGKTLGKGLKGNIIYQGKNLWSVESMGTDSLCTVMLSAIAHRGSISDSDSIEKICKSKKFWSQNSVIKEQLLSKMFDIDNLFGEFTPDTLPSRYLRTYCAVEKCWYKPPWKEEFSIKNN